MIIKLSELFMISVINFSEIEGLGALSSVDLTSLLIDEHVLNFLF